MGPLRQSRLTDKGASTEHSILKTLHQIERQQRSPHLSKKCVSTALYRLLSTVKTRLRRVQQI